MAIISAAATGMSVHTELRVEIKRIPVRGLKRALNQTRKLIFPNWVEIKRIPVRGLKLDRVLLVMINLKLVEIKRIPVRGLKHRRIGINNEVSRVEIKRIPVRGLKRL
jgi:hypothetical protein